MAEPQALAFAGSADSTCAHTDSTTADAEDISLPFITIIFTPR